MSSPHTSVQQSAESPAIPEDFGVVIRVTPYPPSASSRLTVHGAFHLPRAITEIVARPLQRCVVLVVQRVGEQNALTPFREQVLFDDDDQLTPGGVAGYFHIDVFDEQGGGVPGEYHFFVSMDEHISNVLALGVAP